MWKSILANEPEPASEAGEDTLAQAHALIDTAEMLLGRIREPD